MKTSAEMPHVIITGTTRGLGFCLCRLYLNRGYLVTGFARSASPDDFSDYVDGNQYKHIMADLSDLKNMDLIISEFLDRRSQTIILNAADYSIPGQFSNEDQVRQLSLNLLSPIMVVRDMLLRKYSYRPQVIYISSIMAKIYDIRNPAYSAAKAAVSDFIDGTRIESNNKVGFLKVIAGPMYPDNSAFPFFKKWTSMSYKVASEIIFRKSVKDQTIFIPGIWRYIIWLGSMLGKKRMSAMINKFR